MPENKADLLVWKPIAMLTLSLFMLAFGGLSFLFLCFLPKREIWEWFIFICYFFWTLAALFGTICSLRTRVECAANGVRWRDWRGVWRAARWDEVRDFHQRIGKNETYFFVETSQGNFRFGPLGDEKLIAEKVAESATNALVRDWEVKGERLSDAWPRRFEFCPSGRNDAAIISLLGVLASFVLVAALLIWWLPPRGELTPLLWFLAYIAPVLLLPILPFVIWIFVWARAREARRFRGQSVEISPLGIVFEGETRIELAYSQIEEWHWIKRDRTRFLQLRSAGASIEIPAFIVGFASLCRILERFSAVALVKASKEFSMPGGEVQTAPDGTLSFSFYDLNVRMLVWLFAGQGLLMSVLPLLFRLSDPERPLHDQTPGFVGIPLFLGALLLHFYFRRSQLRLTSEDLQWLAPFHNRFIAWQDIESFGSTPTTTGWIEVAEKKVSLSYLWVPITQRSRLHTEIEKRAFNATGEWK